MSHLSSPDHVFELGPDSALRRVVVDDAEEIWALIDRERTHLRPWFAWLDGVQNVQDVEAFVRGTQVVDEQGPTAYECVVLIDDRVQGLVGINRISWINRCANLGYWLAKGSTRRGHVRRGVGALAAYAFETLGLHRLEIRAATHNGPSRAVAEAAGFVYEGTLRGGERVNGVFHDLAVYSRLATDTRSSDVSTAD